MVIRFDLTVEDLIAFTRYHYDRSPSIRRARFVAMLLIVVVPCLIVPLLLVPSEYVTIALTAGTVITLGAAYRMPGAYARNIDRQVRKTYAGRVNEGIFGPHELELTATTLIKRTPVSEGSTRLDALGPLAVTDDYAFLYASPTTAFVIPRHAVTKGDFDKFAAALKDRIDPHLERALG